ncbi:uncharacterized protein LOC111394097 [Olea europaea var. sylvestris]|uniref:uncharacterized protein LOC111394097 n=1 Tax=Olea europaea var. sylvestris TaxID=158386 RepID=UPI000C1D7C71|nr:uncharacterized protein LOC111394097 [Olea europaea var. sylvestris]
MASTCISNCINDARVPVRATYVNLYKWPESDAEFVRSVSSKTHRNGPSGGATAYGRPRVVDSISCRQLYLRSYTFSREEDYKDDEKTIKCLGRGKEKQTMDNKRKRKSRGRGGDRGSGSGGGRRKCKRFRRAKAVSCAALVSIFRRLLSCTTEVDVVN